MWWWWCFLGFLRSANGTFLLNIIFILGVTSSKISDKSVTQYECHAMKAKKNPN